jgi:hypothetical protein
LDYPLTDGQHGEPTALKAGREMVPASLQSLFLGVKDSF